MSSRKRRPVTLIFAGVVMILVGLTLWDYRRSKSREGLEDGEMKVLDLAAFDAVEIQIQSKDQSIQLKKDAATWKMLQPLQDDTDEGAIAGLLNSLSSAKIQKISDDDAKTVVDWSKYGLDPGVKIELSTDKGQKDVFSVSANSAYDGSYYIRKNDRLFLGDRSWAHFADKQVNTLRSHKIWRANGEVIRVQVKTDVGGKPQSAVLVRTEKGWSVQPAFDLPLQAEKVGSWLSAIEDLRATDFASLHPSDKDRADFLLKKPSMELQFTIRQDGKESQLHWLIGQDKANDVYVETDSRGEIYKVGKFSLRDIRVSLDHFLDSAPALQFPIEEAMEIDLSIDGKSQKFLRKEKDWELQGVAVKAEALADFVQKIRSLDPVSAEVPAGVIFKPGDSLVVKSKAGTLFELAWSAEKDHMRWLRIGKLKERFKVSGERLNSILKTEFKPKPAEKDKHP